MLKCLLIIMFLLPGMLTVTAQEKKNLTLSDIYERPTFVHKRVRGMESMQDGDTYAAIEKGEFNVYSYKTGKKVKTLFNFAELVLPGESDPLPVQDYALSDDESKVLLMTNYSPIYRHSFTADYYVYDIATKELFPLSDGGSQRLATFSPDASKVAFMRDNNLFVKDLTTKEETQFTSDGLYNHIINGAPDWVYEEEFGFAQGFFWSPDNTKIAFYHFDESNVKEFQMEVFEGLYPEWYSFKYPKAGEDNSIVEVYVYDLSTKKTIKMDTGEETDIYIPRMKWTKDSNYIPKQPITLQQKKNEIIHPPHNHVKKKFSTRFSCC